LEASVMPSEEEKSKAIRLARAIASDISLYNEEKIKKGIEGDNLFELIDEDLQEGRDLYKSRVSPELYRTTNYYERAIVDIIVRSRGHIRSRLWL
jgi:hypothetical protein